ncbi:MAG: alpha/beta hydrolase [Deltaproteobacteria bacterium]|nr:alpha/beta hydrolase [Deltaproteobacteria bacterium]
MSPFPAPRSVRVSPPSAPEPIHLSVHEQGEGTAVVFSHGFPELGYSWRHQLPAVAAAGFRAIAPDQRGYGGSSRPERISAYGLRDLCGDLAGLLDALEIEKAVFVGHDWGGMVAWGMPVLYPERTLGVVGVCTPYLSMRGTDAIRELVDGDDDRHYILWFQKPGVAEAAMDGRVRILFERMLRGAVSPEKAAARMFRDGKLDMNPFRRTGDPDPDPEEMGAPFATAEEVDTYVRAFEKTGFGGGINWYRNIDANARDVPEMGQKKLSLPCLMLTAEWDMALRPELAEGMADLCPDLELHMIERAGHWVQQEAADEVNERLVDWLRRRFAA